MKKNNSIHNALRYSNIAFQMLAIILIGVFGGQKLDVYFEFTHPICTVIFSLLAVFAAIHIVIKDVTRNNSK